MTTFTETSMQEKLIEEVKGLSTYLEDDDYINAINDALRETGFSLPTSDDFEVLWIKNRAKRHLFFYLQTESAHKFKVDQINLQQRFEHYKDLIAQMDKAYEEALESNPEKFAGAQNFALFGSKIDAGFSYESQTGIDTTYASGNKVVVSPSDAD